MEKVYTRRGMGGCELGMEDWKLSGCLDSTKEGRMLQFPDPLNAQGTYDHRFSPPDKPVSKVLPFPQFADKEKTIQSATMIRHQGTSFPGLSGCLLLHKQYTS